MPFYEFKCRNCGKVFENYVRTVFSKAEPVCPSCGSHEADKIVSLCGSSSSSSGASASAASCAPSGG